MSGTGSVIGLDPGAERVGIAASDPSGVIATPVATVPRRDGVLWPRLASEIAERSTCQIVVGLPRQMDGSEGDAALAARRFADEVARRTALPVAMWDERLTSVQAERALIAGGMRRRRRRQTIDAVAAALMLQNWLDAARRSP